MREHDPDLFRWRIGGIRGSQLKAAFCAMFAVSRKSWPRHPHGRFAKLSFALRCVVNSPHLKVFLVLALTEHTRIPARRLLLIRSSSCLASPQLIGRRKLDRLQSRDSTSPQFATSAYGPTAKSRPGPETSDVGCRSDMRCRSPNRRE